MECSERTNSIDRPQSNFNSSITPSPRASPEPPTPPPPGQPPSGPLARTARTSNRLVGRRDVLWVAPRTARAPDYGSAFRERISFLGARRSRRKQTLKKSASIDVSIARLASLFRRHGHQLIPRLKWFASHASHETHVARFSPVSSRAPVCRGSTPCGRRAKQNTFLDSRYPISDARAETRRARDAHGARREGVPHRPAPACHQTCIGRALRRVLLHRCRP